MAIFDPKNVPVISKLTIGEKTYYLKDAEARELLALLGTAAKKDVAAGVSAEEQGLVTGAQVQAAIAGIQADKGILFAVSEAHIDLPVGIGDGAQGLTAVFIGVDPQGLQRFGVERLYLAAI